MMPPEQPDGAEILRRVEALEREVARLNAAAQGTGTSMTFPRAITTPTPSEITRGFAYLTPGAAGVADTVKVIVKDVADAYTAFQVVP